MLAFPASFSKCSFNEETCQDEKSIIMIGLIYVGLPLVGVGRFTGPQRQFDVLSHSLKAIRNGTQLLLNLWTSRPLPTPAA